MATDQIPREAKLVSLLLTSSGIPECEPKVIQQLIEFMYRYTTDVLQDALIFSEHGGKTEIDTSDVRMAIQSQINHMFVSPPSREVMLELAQRRNVHPLPLFEEKIGFRLPLDQSCLLAANYRVTSLRRPPARSEPPPMDAADMR